MRMRTHLKHFQRTFSESPLESDVSLKVVIVDPGKGVNPEDVKSLELIQSTCFPFTGFFDKRKAAEDAERWGKYLHGEIMYLQNNGSSYRAFLYKRKEVQNS